MAFDLRRLCNGGFTGRGTQIWTYRTDDSVSVVVLADYFLTAWPKLKLGDRIFVTVVSSIDTTSEAFVDEFDMTVTAVSRTSVSVAVNVEVLPAGSSAATINAELARVSAAGGGIVQLGAGLYGGLTEFIAVPSTVLLKGAGAGITRLVWAAAATANNSNNGGWVSFAGAVDSRIEDVTFDFSAVVATGPQGVVFCAPAIASLPNLITYDTLVGTFVVGETVTGGTSGASGEILKNPTGILSLYGVKGTFTLNETITGLNSGATCRQLTGVTNVGAHRCALKRCEVIGVAFSTMKHIYCKGAQDIDILDCIVDGNSITETVAHEFYYTGGAQVDQEGITAVGSTNIRFRGNRVRYMAGVGLYCYVDSRTKNNDNKNILIEENLADQCLIGIKVESGNDSGTNYGLQSSVDVVCRGNTVTSPWVAGLNVIMDYTSAITVANTTVMSGVIFDGNIVDMRGSKRDANHAQQGIIITFDDAGISGAGSYSFPGCEVINNVFLSGGGGTAVTYGNSFVNADGWIVRGNTFDRVANAATTASVYLNKCDDMEFSGNRITNPGKQFGVINACLRIQYRQNYHYGNPSISSSFGTTWTGTSSGAQITGNIFDQQGGNSNYCLVGSNPGVGTGVEMYGNIFVGTTLNMLATFEVYLVETGTTQTHGFGQYSPANGGANFTITNGKFNTTSRVSVQQTAGTVLPFKVDLSVAGAMTVTPSAVFAGTSTYVWQILN